MAVSLVVAYPTAQRIETANNGIYRRLEYGRPRLETSYDIKEYDSQAVFVATFLAHRDAGGCLGDREPTRLYKAVANDNHKTLNVSRHRSSPEPLPFTKYLRLRVLPSRPPLSFSKG